MTYAPQECKRGLAARRCASGIGAADCAGSKAGGRRGGSRLDFQVDKREINGGDAGPFGGPRAAAAVAIVAATAVEGAE